MEQLGIDGKLLAAQVVNFGIIFVVLSKLLYKPILTMLEKRRREIEAGLAITEKMRLEEEKLSQKREKLLETARKEARAIIEEGKKLGKDAEKHIVEEAHKEAALVIAKGKEDVGAMHEAMQKTVRGEAVELAAAMAKRLLTGLLTNADQHRLIASHLKDLESVERKNEKS